MDRLSKNPRIFAALWRENAMSARKAAGLRTGAN